MNTQRDDLGCILDPASFQTFTDGQRYATRLTGRYHGAYCELEGFDGSQWRPAKGESVEVEPGIFTTAYSWA